jgi:uncharacterized repeat protein (TIGR01451 family)
MHQYRQIFTLSLCLILYSTVYGYVQPQYTLTDLGAFQPRAIAGTWIVGQEPSGLAFDMPIRLNIQTGERLTLPHAGYGAWVEAVNDTGEAVGNIPQPFPSGACCGPTWAALWNADGSLHYLPGGGGAASTFAFGINSYQAVAGTADVLSVPALRAHRWLPGRPLEALGTLGGNTSSGAGIDAQGRVWGSGRTPGSEDFPITARTHAAVFHLDGRVQDLGTLDGQFSSVQAVTPEGQGIGTSGAWAFTATAEGGLTALPIPPGFGFCSGRSMASGGASVGVCVQPGGAPHLDVYHATLWPDPRQTVDLNTVANTGGWVLESATGISAEGEIVGTMISQGQRRGYLLTPIPAGPSLALTVNQATFQPGQTLHVTLDLSNPGPILTTDVYVGVILPDGVNTLFLTNFAPLEGVITTLSSDPRTFARLLRNVSWPAGMRATQQEYFTHTFTGLEPLGTYHFLVGWTKPNSLEDGRIDEGDVLALAWAPFTFTRGGTEALYAKMQAIRARRAK